MLFLNFSGSVLILDKEELKVVTCNQESQNLLKKSNEYLFGKKLNQIFSNYHYFFENIKEITKKPGTYVIKDRLKLDRSNF